MNYQKDLERIIEHLPVNDNPLRLLLHSCCAPCSSYVLEYLANYFAITVLYYNPNIYPEEEYLKRVEEQQNLINTMKLKYPVKLIRGSYNPQDYYDIVRGCENDPEGGERCFRCYRMRLSEAARYAREGGFDYFTTTLSISPYKNADKLNEIGNEISEQFGVKFLPSDFKKKNGYLRSIELSKEYGLYRQDYCGCIFSKKARDLAKAAGNAD